MLGLVGRTIGRYHILEQVGQGGMSSVFRAVELTTNRTVAIKVISPYLANEPQFKARFEREIRLLRRLQHPNIIPILDFGEAEGLAFIVMPFIATGTLHERLQEGPLDPMQGGRIIDQIASALTCAHEDGVIHRDVKPSNVLLDQQGNAILSDFGFARPQDASQNLTGSALIGTPAYMSPEQCRGEPLDARSDQYSFAIMLYQITTGQLPFDGETPMAVAMKHVSVPLPRPRSVSPSLPEGVELVLIKALAKDPALRFASVKDLNQAFQTELKAVLDPKLRNAGARTVGLDRTAELYRRYQNVAPPAGRKPDKRPAILATLLLLLACALSAGAVGIISPELFAPASAAPAMSLSDIQSTVDVVLTANAPAAGTESPPGALETSVYAAVVQTLQASLTPGADTPPVDAGREPTDSLPAVVIFPTSGPTATTALPTLITPSRTIVPSATPAATHGPTATSPDATLTSPPPSPTSPSPTVTSPPPSPMLTSPPPSPTLTSPPPSPTETASPVPPTNTAPPPTPTPKKCEWDTGGVDIHGDTVSVEIRNTGDLTLHVSSVGITWSSHDETLRSVRLMGEIWRGWEHGPSFSVHTNKDVGPGSNRTLEFEFAGYHFDGSASVDVDGDC
ncbi:MAG: serine/threonine-protein kinase [Chloroflexi bacterium]|nr:serine/threonine-protein kinase [Chloroflexota bacterium]